MFPNTPGQSNFSPVDTFETSAVSDDASHLTLRDPLPFPAGREYKIIVYLSEENKSPAERAGEDKSSPEWITKFLEEIRIDDPAFVRYPQGEARPIKGLDCDDPA